MSKIDRLLSENKLRKHCDEARTYACDHCGEYLKIEDWLENGNECPICMEGTHSGYAKCMSCSQILEGVEFNWQGHERPCQSIEVFKKTAKVVFDPSGDSDGHEEPKPPVLKKPPIKVPDKLPKDPIPKEKPRLGLGILIVIAIVSGLYFYNEKNKQDSQEQSYRDIHNSIKDSGSAPIKFLSDSITEVTPETTRPSSSPKPALHNALGNPKLHALSVHILEFYRDYRDALSKLYNAKHETPSLDFDQAIDRYQITKEVRSEYEAGIGKLVKKSLSGLDSTSSSWSKEELNWIADELAKTEIRSIELDDQLRRWIETRDKYETVESFLKSREYQNIDTSIYLLQLKYSRYYDELLNKK